MDTYLTFSLNESDKDWNYPFDLCGGMYRLLDAKNIIASMDGDREMIKNPNVFELKGNES